MEEIIKCELCKSLNSKKGFYCTNCGQRFKPIEISKRTSEKQSRKIIILIILCAIYMLFHSEINSSIASLGREKTINALGMPETLEQNSVFDLPTTANLSTSFGGKKVVVIKWIPQNIDTSTPGVKTSAGKIQGYNGTIHFSVKVLENAEMNSISNCSVNNSELDLKVTVPEHSKWIWVKIKKGKEVEEKTLVVNSGELNTKIYLPFNAGEYEILLYRSGMEDKLKGYYLWKKFKVNNKDSRDMRYLLPEEYVESDSKEIIEVARAVVFGLKTDREKTLAIHDFVARNISYDTEAYFNNTKHQYSALETLEGKKAVCNGYANLTAALNRAVGIKTKIVSGTAGDSKDTVTGEHAWNETYVDGKWVIQDTTWDAGGINDLTKKFVFHLSHKYFDPTIDNFQKDHHKDKEA